MPPEPVTKNTVGRTRFQVPPQTGPFHVLCADPGVGYLSTPGMEGGGETVQWADLGRGPRGGSHE